MACISGPAGGKGIPVRRLFLLQEYLIIPLDIFRKCCENTGIRGKLDAWLYFISSDRIGDIKRVVSAYPEFETLYREVFEFRYHVKELDEAQAEVARLKALLEQSQAQQK